jgi:hypothetical protein
LLDTFIEAALAEDADARETMRAAPGPTWSAGDDPEAFLTRTIGFLESRADRAELLARLNRAFAAQAQAPEPPSATVEAPGEPPTPVDQE